MTQATSAETQSVATQATRTALLQKGFRPFFLLASLFAALAIPLWLAMLAGELTPPGAVGTRWHAHEMLFGYTVAVIAGFLLTAVENWTKRPTLRGAPLLGLALLWVAGRVAVALGNSLLETVALVSDLAFLPMLAVALARPLIAARNQRNYGFLGLLTLLFVANTLSWLGPRFDHPEWPSLAHQVALDGIVLLILLVGGRIIPAFTRNATGAPGIASHRWLDYGALSAMVLLTLIDLAARFSVAAGVVSLVVAALAAARAHDWGARHARAPMLWVLHLGYLWVPAGLALRGWALLSFSVPVSMATHALTVGAIGTLTLGMMARVSLGHTGRPIQATRSVTLAFGVITAAAFTRVVAPLVPGAFYLEMLMISGTLWTLAFALFLATFVPILTAPRADAKPG